jgi:hypothetical protein
MRARSQTPHSIKLKSDPRKKPRPCEGSNLGKQRNA